MKLASKAHDQKIKINNIRNIQFKIGIVILFTVVLQIWLTGSVSAKYFRYLPESDVVMEECYEESFNADGLQIFFANDADYFCFFFNSSSPLIGIDVDNYYFFDPEDPLDVKYAINFSVYMAEIILVRTLDFTNDNNFKFVITRYINETAVKLDVDLTVKPRTPSQAFEVEADTSEIARGIWMFIFGSWYSGILWALFLISLYRMALKPWFYTSTNNDTRRAESWFGKYISCEAAKELPGMYLYKFKQGTKVGKYYCRENYETLKEHVSFCHFMIYWHFYPWLIPTEITIPENCRWKKQVDKKNPFNYFIKFLKIIGVIIPSTHLAMYLDNKVQRMDTKEDVIKIKTLVIDFMEDRFTTGWDARYQICEMNTDKKQKALEFRSIEAQNVNYTERIYLETHVCKDLNNPREGEIIELKISNEHKMLEHFTNLRDGLKDRVSRTEIKCIYEAKMLSKDKQIELLMAENHQIENRLNTLQNNYQTDLDRDLKEAFSHIKIENKEFPKRMASILGMVTGGVSRDRAISIENAEHLESIAQKQMKAYEDKIVGLEKANDVWKKRVELLEAKITQKSPGDLSEKELEILVGEGNHDNKSS